ncbi:MAG: hypothetical protein WC720_05580 [Candidatus Shapirobacteria bacterium]|jgi:hypothetical protein
MKKTIYKKPKLKLPVLKYFKFEEYWQKQGFNLSEKKKVQLTANKIDAILLSMSEEERTKLISPPSLEFDPIVCTSEWNDFLAVVFGIKPACLIGHNFNKKMHNPIAKFARKNSKLFESLLFSDYWYFGFDKNYRTVYHKMEDGFVYNKDSLSVVINKNVEIFKDFDINNPMECLKDLVKSNKKNPADFHKKLGLLLGYSLKSINSFIKIIKL